MSEAGEHLSNKFMYLLVEVLVIVTVVVVAISFATPKRGDSVAVRQILERPEAFAGASAASSIDLVADEAPPQAEPTPRLPQPLSASILDLFRVVIGY